MNFGIETSKRNLDTISINGQTKSPVKANWRELQGRAYAYWAPLNWLSASAEYQHEIFHRPLAQSFDDRDDKVGIPDLTTRQITLGTSLFSLKGITTRFTANRIIQKGTFATTSPTGTTTSQLSDQFWVVDTSISYRLKKRMGRITVGAKNLLNKTFLYHNTDITNTRTLPGRTIFTQLSLSF